MQHLVLRLAHVMAILGGLVLCALVVLACLSILGRSGNVLGHADWLVANMPWLASLLAESGIGQIRGDYEILESGVGFAIFAFLPICQIRGGHATVDVFTSALPNRWNRTLVAFWEVLLAAVVVLICVQLFEGLQGKFRTGETTFLLQFPVWWSYAASFAASIVAALVAVWCAGARLAEVVTGRDYLPVAKEPVSKEAVR